MEQNLSIKDQNHSQSDKAKVYFNKVSNNQMNSNKI